jgi:hypothetical protein
MDTIFYRCTKWYPRTIWYACKKRQTEDFTASPSVEGVPNGTPSTEGVPFGTPVKKDGQKNLQLRHLARL